VSVKNTKLNVDNTIMEMMNDYFPIKIDIYKAKFYFFIAGKLIDHANKIIDQYDV
jgi:hypothetical protein